MRNIILASLGVFIISSSFHCRQDFISTANCHKGKLVIVGVCRQLVVQVMDTNIDTSRVQTTWYDQSDNNRVYENVFTINNLCTFPGTVQQGEEFYFQFDDNPPAQTCAICMAWRDSPAKHNSIKICGSK